jgi:hypothetical protein
MEEKYKYAILALVASLLGNVVGWIDSRPTGGYSVLLVVLIPIPVLSQTLHIQDAGAFIRETLTHFVATEAPLLVARV